MATSSSAQRCDLSYPASDVLSDLPFQLVPHFLLFLDGVYQLMTHYPLSFEYTEVRSWPVRLSLAALLLPARLTHPLDHQQGFLRAIWHASLSCFFGTFIFNCEADRVARAKAMASAPSLWSHIAGARRVAVLMILLHLLAAAYFPRLASNNTRNVAVRASKLWLLQSHVSKTRR